MFLKLCFIWLIIGFTCAAIATLYDIVVNRVYIGKRELKSMLLMVAFGIVSVPLTVYFLVVDIKENKNFKRKSFSFLFIFTE